MHYLENKYSSSNLSACDAFSHSLNHNVYESSDATQSKWGPRSQYHLLKIIFSVRKLEVVLTFASPGVLRNTLFQGQQLSNANTFTFSRLMTEMLFHKPTLRDKYNFVFKICGLKWLLPLWRLFVKRAESLNCYWKLHMSRPRDFILLFSTKTFWTYFLMNEFT